MKRRLVDPFLWLAALFLLVGLACAALTSQPTETPEPLPGGPTPSPSQRVELKPVPTPPQRATTYYSCPFNVSVPSELTTDDNDWYATFTPTSGEPVWVSISVSKPWPGIDPETAFARVIDSYGLKNPDEHSVTALDDLSRPVTGIQSDFITGEEHYRVLVFVRPDTCLGDMGPTEVVYEITAKAPADSWEIWEPIFDVIFQSIYMKDCWGV